MDLQISTRRVADRAWVRRTARASVAARGAVFLILGYLLARIAAGAQTGGSSEDAASGPGVAQAVVQQPGGRVVVFALGVGLIAYALYSLVDAIVHHGDESSQAKQWLERGTAVWGFVVYGAFGAIALVTAFSGHNDSGSSRQENAQQQQWSARVLNWPGGPLWLGALALVVIVIAAYLTVQAVRRSFLDELDQTRMSRSVRRGTAVVGVVGTLGRAALFGIVGWFILTAAIDDDPRRGRGVDGAVRQLAANAYGATALWLLAVTLVAYAAYLTLGSRYWKV